MAVLDSLKGLQVTINVCKNAVKEYKLPKDGATNSSDSAEVKEAKKTVIKYIEAVDDKEFAIRLCAPSTFEMPCPLLSFKTTVDGTWIQEPLLFENHLKPFGFNTLIEGTQNQFGTDTLVRPMKFKRIKISKFAQPKLFNIG